MSTRLKEKQEKILHLLEALAEESAKGTLIVVEGKKDLEALRTLNVTGPILTVKTGGKSFGQAVQQIEQACPSEVILLLDFDRRGKEGTGLLKRSLECAHIKPNLKFWSALSSLLAREVQCIEGLNAYLERLQRKTC